MNKLGAPHQPNKRQHCSSHYQGTLLRYLMRGRLLVGRWELQLKLFCELWRLNREVKRSSSSSLLCRSRQNMSQYITTTFRPLLVRYVNKMLNICEISVVTNIIITNPALPAWWVKNEKFPSASYHAVTGWLINVDSWPACTVVHSSELKVLEEALICIWDR